MTGPIIPIGNPCMIETVFVDTNVLVYARDATEPEKQRAAMEWLSTLWKNRKGRLSFQVLQEFYVTVTRKLRPGLPDKEARDDIRCLVAWKPVKINTVVIKNTWSVQDRFRLSWWDSLIVSAALVTECRYLLPKDLQVGQELDGLKVISPFKTTTAAVFSNR